jgi:hypothetical protein
MTLTPEDIEAIADAVARKLNMQDSLDRIETMLKILLQSREGHSNSFDDISFDDFAKLQREKFRQMKKERATKRAAVEAKEKPPLE